MRKFLLWFTVTLVSCGAASAQVAPAPKPQGFVSINFDDGYESAYQNGLPILDKAGLKSTLFVITHQLNHKDFLTTQQLLALQAKGHEIGVHTQTHPFLSKLNVDQQRQEILGAFDDLVALGIHPAFLAYPYGDYNSISVSIARSTFIGSRTVNQGFVDKTSDPQTLNAFTVESTAYHIYCFNDIAALINQAVVNGKWMIIVFHRVDNDRGDGISVPHQTIQQIANFLVANKIRVVTMSQGWQLLNQP